MELLRCDCGVERFIELKRVSVNGCDVDVSGDHPRTLFCPYCYLVWVYHDASRSSRHGWRRGDRLARRK